MQGFQKGNTPWMKGKHHSVEAKRKMREGHKGQLPWNKGKKGISEETRIKMREARKGKSYPKMCRVVNGENNPNWKGGISKTKRICKFCGKVFYTRMARIKKGRGKFCDKQCYGKWRSENIRGEKCSFFGKHLIGEKSPRWKGGIDFWDRRGSNNEVKLWRKMIYKRDGYRCVICGKTGGKLNAHHIRSWKDFPELRFDIDNGITMCQSCHELVYRETPLFAIRKLGMKKC